MRMPTSEKTMDLLSLAFIIVLNAAWCLPIFRSPLPPGDDAMGHLFKVWFLDEALSSGSPFPRWCPEWYGGYPFLRYYPPLSYYLILLLARAFGSLFLGYKLAVVVAFVVGSASTYWLTLMVTGRRLPGLVASAAYSLSPFHGRVAAVEGAYPQLLAVGIFPLSVALLYRAKKTGSNKAVFAAGLSIAALTLTHHTSAFVALILMALLAALDFVYIIFLTKPPASETYFREEELGKALKVYILLVFYGIGLSAFWLVPAFMESKHASFLYDIGVATANSVLPIRLFVRSFGFTWYLGTSILAPAMLVLLLKRNRDTLSFALMAFASVFLALGVYSPLPLKPLLEIVALPGRFLLGCLLASSVLAGFFLNELCARLTMVKKKILPLALTALLIALMAFDAHPVRAKFEYVHEPSPGYSDATLWLRDDPQFFRVYQPGMIYVYASTASFPPVHSGKPILEGWYIQGSPLRETITSIDRDVFEHENASYAAKTLTSLCVKYVVVDSLRYEHAVQHLLNTGRFEQVRQFEEVVVLKNLENVSFVTPQPNASILFIGERRQSRYVFNVPGMGLFCRAKGPSDYIDDYSADFLGQFNLVVLYRYNYRLKSAAERVLRAYLEKGGVVIVDTSGGPDARGTFLGVDSYLTTINGSLQAKLLQPLPEFSDISFGNFSPAQWDGQPWMSAAYRNVPDPILEANGHIVLGVKEVGLGKIVYLGLNWFYHASFYDNPEEYRFILKLFSWASNGIPSTRESVSWTIQKYAPGEVNLELTASGPAFVRISEAYFPGWRVHVDGKKVETFSIDGLMAIKIRQRGSHRVTLRYGWRPSDGIGLAISIGTLAFAIIQIYEVRVWKRLFEKIRF